MKKLITTIVGLALTILSIPAFYTWGNFHGEQSAERELQEQAEVYEQQVDRMHDRLEDKIAELKWGVVDDLSNKCEVQGVAEDKKEGIIIWDTNNKPSVGAWMFQTATVQYYSEKLRGETLSTAEANRLALTHGAARQLAHDIIFDEIGGIWNWTNCAKKLGLAGRIETIRSLEN